MLAFATQHRDLLLYLLPSLALALVIRALANSSPIFFIFTLAGTICHELSHFCLGFLTGARPASFTIVPRRVGDHWELGSVMLTRVRWYNAAPSALAPFLILLLPLAVAWWRARGAWHFQWLDVILAFALAPQFLSFWPSNGDWRIAWRSWPCVLAIGMGWILFQNVRN
ncbi:MAG: hypothetical protein V4463_03140 [Pseudomonadota bacterium]